MRWITGHSVYEAHDDRLVGAEPIYSYGIVMEVSNVDPGAIIVNSCIRSLPVRLVILHDTEEDIEILSTGAQRHGQ